MATPPKFKKDAKTGKFAGSEGPGRAGPTPVPVAPVVLAPSAAAGDGPAAPLALLWESFSGRQASGGSVAPAGLGSDDGPDGNAGNGGNASNGTVSDVVTCSECATTRRRGSAHRCAAPGLIVVTSATEKVLAACRAAGGYPLIVGGSVRDALMSKTAGTRVTSKDIDIEVYRLGEFAPLERQLARIGRVDLTGVSFGVLKALVDGEDFDVALPRTDEKTGDSHQDFTTRPDANLDEVTACARRDFTMNAMGWDPLTGELVDPWGGSGDLAAGILRHTTDAFKEDPLRVLRGVQFAARFNLVLAPETAQLSQSMADGFEHLAAERVWGEIAKLASHGVKISRGLDVLHQSGWERHFPELAAIRDVAQDAVWHPEGPVHVHVGLAADRAAEIAVRDNLDVDARQLLVLAAILHDFGKAGPGTQTSVAAGVVAIQSHGHAELGVAAAGAFLARLNAPHRVAEHILPLVREHMSAASFGDTDPTPTAVRRLLRRLAAGPNGPSLADWARLLEADSEGRGSGNKPAVGHRWVAVADTLGGPAALRPLLRGNHLAAAGLTPGPQFAVLIRASVAAQDDGLFVDEAGAVKWLTGRLAADAAPPR